MVRFLSFISYFSPFLSNLFFLKKPGKTSISIALAHIFGFGHTQSDDVLAAPAFIRNVTNLLYEHDVVIADKYVVFLYSFFDLFFFLFPHPFLTIEIITSNPTACRFEILVQTFPNLSVSLLSIGLLTNLGQQYIVSALIASNNAVIIIKLYMETQLPNLTKKLFGCSSTLHKSSQPTKLITSWR